MINFSRTFFLFPSSVVRHISNLLINPHEDAIVRRDLSVELSSRAKDQFGVLYLLLWKLCSEGSGS